MVHPFTIHDSHSHPPRLRVNGRRKTEDAELAARIHDSRFTFTSPQTLGKWKKEVGGCGIGGRVHDSRFTFTSPRLWEKGRRKTEVGEFVAAFTVQVRRSRTCQPGSREEGARPEAFRLSVHDSSRASRSRGRPVTPDEHGLPGREDLAVRKVVGPVQTVAPPNRGLVWLGSVRPLFGDHSPSPHP